MRHGERGEDLKVYGSISFPPPPLNPLSPPEGTTMNKIVLPYGKTISRAASRRYRATLRSLADESVEGDLKSVYKRYRRLRNKGNFLFTAKGFWGDKY